MVLNASTEKSYCVAARLVASETNLGTAAAYGIRWLIYVSRYSSTRTPVPSPSYTSIHYFNELLPRDGGMVVSLPKHPPA